MRDDVERALATTVGSQPLAYNKAIATAKQLQIAVSSAPAVASVAAQNYVALTACANGVERAGVEAAEQEMLNNRARQKAMIDAYVALIDASVSQVTSTNGMVNPICPELP